MTSKAVSWSSPAPRSASGKPLLPPSATPGPRSTSSTLTTTPGRLAEAVTGATFIQCDLTSEGDVTATVEAIGRASGRVDILVNNAAGSRRLSAWRRPRWVNGIGFSTST